MAALHVTLCTIIHEVIQIAEYPLSDRDTEIVAPTSYYWIHLVDECHGGRAQVFMPNPFEFLPYLSNRLVARFDQLLIGLTGGSERKTARFC